MPRKMKHGHLAGVFGGGRPPAEWVCWIHMKQRCYNPKATGYVWYGGRGISVCNRWLNSFVDFLSDMGPRPTAQHSIDRIDVNGNYEPSNCRWATWKEQAANQRIRSTNKSGVTGVSFDAWGNRWVAKRRRRFLGGFKTKDEAIAALANNES